VLGFNLLCSNVVWCGAVLCCVLSASVLQVLSHIHIHIHTGSFSPEKLL
jgi:hypothetical protein